MFRKNRVKFSGLFTTLGVIGSVLVSQASVTCPSPNPAATDWACVDMYLTPSPSALFSNIAGVQFQIGITPSATLLSAAAIYEAAVLNLFATNPSPTYMKATDFTNAIGASYPITTFNSGINPLFEFVYGFSTGEFPKFTIDTTSYPLIFSPMTVTASNIILKTQYVLNNGAVTIDNGFPLDLTVASGGGTGTVTSTPTGISCSSGTCRYPFSIGTPVTLAASPTNGSCFTSFTYSGGSTNSNAFNISSYDPTLIPSVTASFSPSNSAITSPTTSEFCTLQEAINTASTGTSVLARTGTQTENLVVNRNNTALTLSGGYTSFTTASTGLTTLHGSLTIQQGALTVDNIAIF